MSEQWTCQRCGACCNRTEMFIPKLGLETGVLLTREECKLFPSSAVRPLYGYSKKDSPKHIHVIEHQMIAMPCMHLDTVNHTCRIYEKRPMACRAYPVEATSRGLYVDDRCPAIKKMGELLKIGLPIEGKGLDNAKDVALKLMVYQRAGFTLATGSYRWFYDFKHEKWQPSSIVLFAQGAGR